MKLKLLIPCALLPADYFVRRLAMVLDACADAEIACVH